MLLPRKKLKVEVEVKESEVTERGESAHTEVSPSTDTPTATILRVEKIFQDQWLVVVNKPSGMLVHRNWATKTEKVFALDQVKELVGNRDVFPVHRLDRPTSGLLVFALDSNIAHDMCEKFAQRTVHKEYLAVVRGWADEKGFIDHPLKRVENKYQKNTNAVVYTTNAKINESTNKKCQRQGEKSLIENDDAVDDDVEDDDTGGDRVQEAQTEYTCLHKAELPFSVSKKFATSRFSLVKLNPRTGRKHQLRRHLKHIFHPIIGDLSHGDLHQNRAFHAHLNCRRLLLVAHRLSFEHPISKQSVTFKAPLGSEILELFAKLGWPSREEDY